MFCLLSGSILWIFSKELKKILADTIYDPLFFLYKETTTQLSVKTENVKNEKEELLYEERKKNK